MINAYKIITTPTAKAIMSYFLYSFGSIIFSLFTLIVVDFLVTHMKSISIWGSVHILVSDSQSRTQRYYPLV